MHCSFPLHTSSSVLTSLYDIPPFSLQKVPRDQASWVSQTTTMYKRNPRHSVSHLLYFGAAICNQYLFISNIRFLFFRAPIAEHLQHYRLVYKQSLADSFVDKPNALEASLGADWEHAHDVFSHPSIQRSRRSPLGSSLSDRVTGDSSHSVDLRERLRTRDDHWLAGSIHWVQIYSLYYLRSLQSPREGWRRLCARYFIGCDYGGERRRIAYT